MMRDGNSLAYGRPYLRSAVARSMYNKIVNENYVKNYDKSKWYRCNLDKVDENMCEKFVQMSLDDDTDAFLKRCFEKSDWLFTHLWHSFAKIFLCWIMTQTSMNGFLGRGSMFVFSQDQFRKLLGVDTRWQADSLLDLGAGDGEVTSVMAPFFKNVYATEVSPVMARILANKGYKVLGIDDWKQNEEVQQYDLISCLNLLDRCDKPITLLKDMRSKLSPSGVLLVGLVLPVSQYVESNKNNRPSEELEVAGKTFEDQIVHVCRLFTDLGFEVTRWTRLPYLCEGDMQQPIYWLNDSVFVLKRASSTS